MWKIILFRRKKTQPSPLVPNGRGHTHGHLTIFSYLKHFRRTTQPCYSDCYIMCYILIHLQLSKHLGRHYFAGAQPCYSDCYITCSIVTNPYCRQGLVTYTFLMLLHGWFWLSFGSTVASWKCAHPWKYVHPHYRWKLLQRIIYFWKVRPPNKSK